MMGRRLVGSADPDQRRFLALSGEEGDRDRHWMFHPGWPGAGRQHRGVAGARVVELERRGHFDVGEAGRYHDLGDLEERRDAIETE